MTERSPAMVALDKRVKERVQKGIEFLRKNYGEDWVEHIDMATLSLDDGSACVLGQVHPAYHDTYDDGFKEEGYSHALSMFFERGGDDAEYGFCTREESYAHLQKAWEEAIPNEQTRLERLRMAGKA